MDIEDIAEEYSIKDLGRVSPAYECGFTQGANYQKQMDIDKACELYKAEVQQCKNMLNYFKADAGDIIDIERSVDIFRKAMEEQI